MATLVSSAVISFCLLARYYPLWNRWDTAAPISNWPLCYALILTLKFYFSYEIKKKIWSLKKTRIYLISWTYTCQFQNSVSSMLWIWSCWVNNTHKERKKMFGLNFLKIPKYYIYYYLCTRYIIILYQNSFPFNISINTPILDGFLPNVLAQF